MTRRTSTVDPKLLLKISQTAVEDNLWPEVVEDLRQLFHASHSLLFSPHLNPGERLSLWASRTLQPTDFEPYIEYYIEKDVIGLNLEEKGFMKNGSLYFSEELVDDKIFLESEFYNDFLKPLDARGCFGSVLQVEQGITYMPGFYMCFNRGHHSVPYHQSDKDLYRQIIPHLQNALKVRKITHHRQHHELLHFAISKVSNPIFLLNKHKKVLGMNQPAEHFVQTKPYIQIKNRQLSGLGNLSAVINHGSQQISEGSPGFETVL